MSSKRPRPAWLIATVTTATLTLLTAAGCARFGGEIQKSPLGGRVLAGLTAFRGGPHAVENRDEVQLTSGIVSVSVARLNFAALGEVAEVPVENLLAAGDRPLPNNGLCPADMATIDDKFCVDKHEASLVEVLPSGEERAWPYYLPVEGHVVRAVSEKGVYPQGYISGVQAGEACKLSGKRLCKKEEWRTACKGPDPKKFGYGDAHEPGRCNDHGKSGMGQLFNREVADGTAFASNKKMNDPMLNQLEGTLAETGSHESCVNGYGLYDMVGNIHEWTDDPAGTFQGGYYLDVRQNGDGCMYRSDAHVMSYHDYSTGFRCCADVAQ